MDERYWLKVEDLAWQEATREQFILAERGAGFHPKNGTGVATGGFITGSLQGMITTGEITIEMYPNDPDFVAVANKSA